MSFSFFNTFKLMVYPEYMNAKMGTFKHIAGILEQGLPFRLDNAGRITYFRNRVVIRLEQIP